MSVTWTQNGSGQYLVESKEHLLQIMNNGALYTDAGTSPTDYWSSSYLQTSDIDLVNDHANIVPIGPPSIGLFDGVYDGGLFHIKNWSYAGTETMAGLFGFASNALLKRIRLSGVWTLDSPSRAAFLCGYVSGSTVYDVKGDFSLGTVFLGKGDSGCLFGSTQNSQIHGVSVHGIVDFSVDSTSYSTGGVAGFVNGTIMTQCLNVASFPNGIGGGRQLGGIVGFLSNSTLSKSLNGMIGDINGTTSGGVVGSTGGVSHMDSLVNSMTGTLNGSTNCGGVVGYANNGTAGCTATKLINYMHGDITGGDYRGGIVGKIVAGSDTAITKSIVAMQGNVNQSVRGLEQGTPVEIEVTVDTSFGMTFTGNNYGSTTMVVDDALVYDPGFTDLPYINMIGTDADGNVYPWDFVYANIGGKYPEYTHLSVHTAAVSAPYFTDFGLGDSNTVVYLAYANTDTNTLYHDSSLTIVQTAAVTVIVIQAPSAKDDFLFGNVYDITEAGTEVAAAVNELFATGDAVAVNVSGNSTKTTFVNRGGEVDIAGVSALLLPFDPAVADVQDATFTLSDATSVDVGFDQASGDVLVGGTPYSNGDYFILDGKKVRVYDI